MAVPFYWFEVVSSSPTTQVDPSNAGKTLPGTCDACGQVRLDFRHGADASLIALPSFYEEHRIVIHRNLTTGPTGNTLTIPLRWFNEQARGGFSLVARTLGTLDDTDATTMGAYTWNTLPAPGALLYPSVKTFRRIPQTLTPFASPNFSYVLDITGLTDILLLVESAEAYDSQHSFASAHTIYTGDGTITFT